MEGLHARQCQAIDLGTADDERQGRFGERFEGGVDGVHNANAGNLVVGLTREDDRLPAWKWFAYGFVCLSSHQQSVPHGQALEALQIRAQSPRERIAMAYGSIPSHGHNEVQPGLLEWRRRAGLGGRWSECGVMRGRVWRIWLHYDRCWDVRPRRLREPCRTKSILGGNGRTGNVRTI